MYLYVWTPLGVVVFICIMYQAELDQIYICNGAPVVNKTYVRQTLSREFPSTQLERNHIVTNC